VLERAEKRRLALSLVTPAKIRKLQRALYMTAKQEPTRRFHLLYDKVWREDILAHAYACCLMPTMSSSARSRASTAAVSAASE